MSYYNVPDRHLQPREARSQAPAFNEDNAIRCGVCESLLNYSRQCENTDCVASIPDTTVFAEQPLDPEVRRNCMATVLRSYIATNEGKPFPYAAFVEFAREELRKLEVTP